MRNMDKRWLMIKEAMADGLPSHQQSVMNQCLDNVLIESSRFLQKMHGPAALMENASGGATAAGNIAALNQVVLPLIRRVLPGVIANEIVGVQALDGPFGQISSLRVKYANAAAGAMAGQEAFAPRHVADLAKAYSGNENANSPAAADTAALEGLPGNALSIEILKEQVKAKTRKLAARWTIEATQDANAQHGVDLESEIMAALAQHMVLEIDQELLATLRNLPPAATAANTFDQTAISGQSTFVGDEFAALAILIGREANNIAARTRLGVGNFAVVSPDALTILQSAKTSAFARTTEGNLEGPVNVKYVGDLNNSVKVYCDTYAQTSTPVLIGYKGSEVDSGVYYCPYIPLMSTDIVMDPQTMEPTVSFMSRYAVVTLDNKATSLGNSADYYGLVGINAANLSFL
tara:strand:+ start:1055 stop:2272 length:1218 start_codon:yes stop_codon:yes gene_type:complete